MNIIAPKHIIISRTDSIGDVILTLPMAGLLKEKHPDCRITFLGRAYTKPIIALSRHVDAFADWDEIRVMDMKGQEEKVRELEAGLIIHVFPVGAISRLAKKAGIPARMGTTNRLFHWTTCNRLVAMSRRRSKLHEAQLNIRLIRSLTGVGHIPLQDLPAYYGLKDMYPLDPDLEQCFDRQRFNLILHPGSKGSAREWGLDNFRALIRILPEEKFNILITGTKEEGEGIRQSGLFEESKGVTDLTGKVDLQGLISVIARSDGLLAASTGPLHIAAALGKHALGIYPPIRPMDPGRWAPVGINASHLVVDKTCSDCRGEQECHCMKEISPEQVMEYFAKIV